MDKWIVPTCLQTMSKKIFHCNFLLFSTTLHTEKALLSQIKKSCDAVNKIVTRNMLLPVLNMHAPNLLSLT